MFDLSQQCLLFPSDNIQVWEKVSQQESVAYGIVHEHHCKVRKWFSMSSPDGVRNWLLLTCITVGVGPGGLVSYSSSRKCTTTSNMLPWPPSVVPARDPQSHVIVSSARLGWSINRILIWCLHMIPFSAHTQSQQPHSEFGLYTKHT